MNENNIEMKARVNMGGEVYKAGLTHEVLPGRVVAMHNECSLSGVAKWQDAPYRNAGLVRLLTLNQLVEYTLDNEGTLLQVSDTAQRLPQISIVHVEGDLFFGAADLFRKQVARVAEDPTLAVIILRMRNARNLDATSVCALEELIRYTREQGRHLIISGASREVYRILRKSGVLQVLQEGNAHGVSNIFLVEPKNPNMSTRKALLRARQLLGSAEADISIFTTRTVREP